MFDNFCLVNKFDTTCHSFVLNRVWFLLAFCSKSNDPISLPKHSPFIPYCSSKRLFVHSRISNCPLQKRMLGRQSWACSSWSTEEWYRWLQILFFFILAKSLQKESPNGGTLSFEYCRKSYHFPDRHSTYFLDNGY